MIVCVKKAHAMGIKHNQIIYMWVKDLLRRPLYRLYQILVFGSFQEDVFT
jgi:hypothetical protein